MSCPADVLWTKPTVSRFIYFKLLTLIPVSAALIGIAKHSESMLWPASYVALCLVHAGVMNAIKCPHCPYYQMGDKTFNCFIWWGMPRLYKPRRGPESRIVGVYAPLGMLVLTAYPLIWLWHEWELMFLFLLSVVVLVLTIGEMQCSRCLNFECGHNTVSERLRAEFRGSSGPVGNSSVRQDH